MTAHAVDVGAAVPGTPVAEPADEVELDEKYLRSLSIEHLVTLLDKHGVTPPESVDAHSAKAIVDWVVTEYGM